MIKGQEGSLPRLHQGEFRKFQGTHHETEGEAKKRRKVVAALAPLARNRGEIPGAGPYVPTDTKNADLYGDGDGDDGDRVPVAGAARAAGAPAPSTLDTLSAYTADTRGEGVLRLPEPFDHGSYDVTTTPGGGLKWPPAREGAADINEVRWPAWTGPPGHRPGTSTPSRGCLPHLATLCPTPRTHTSPCASPSHTSPRASPSPRAARKMTTTGASPCSTAPCTTSHPT